MDLDQLIRSECELVQSFVGMLGEEQSALKTGQTDALADITPRKSTLIARLNGLAEARNRAMSLAGLPGDHAGLEAWAAKNGPPAVAQRLRLLALASEARELNRLNGQLIAMRLQATQEALNVLGGDNHKHKSTYGPDGQTLGPRTGYRFIDSA